MRNLPDGVRLVPTGDARWIREIFGEFALAMAIGVLSIYAVLVMLFHKFIQPVTILAALPPSAAGAIAALLIFDYSLAINSLIGLLMLMGIVSKNSILIVEYAIMAQRDHGMSRFDSLIDSCSKRARPIVMTTIAMIAGMTPIAMGWAGDPSFRAPMGVAVIGGLLVSTVMSLFIVPAMFTVVDDFQQWLRPQVRRGREARRGSRSRAVLDAGLTRRDGVVAGGGRRNVRGRAGRARARRRAAAGERRAIVLGLAVSAITLVLYGSVPQGWMVFPVMVLALFGWTIAAPAVQALMSRAVPPNEQGLLQGALASMTNLTSIFGPPIWTGLFGFFVSPAAPVIVPGAAFFASAAVFSGRASSRATPLLLPLHTTVPRRFRRAAPRAGRNASGNVSLRGRHAHRRAFPRPRRTRTCADEPQGWDFRRVWEGPSVRVPGSKRTRRPRSAVAARGDELAQRPELRRARAAAPPGERDRAIALVAERVGLDLRALKQRRAHGHLGQERNAEVRVDHLDQRE